MNDAGLLLECVRSNPSDGQAKAIAIDCLIEAGKSRLAATRAVNKVAREGQRIANLNKAESILHSVRRVRTAVRSHFPDLRAAVPIRVADGKHPPVMTGEPPHSEFKGGGLCHHPGAAIRAGYKVRYIRDTRVIVVGAEWILNLP